MACFFFVFCVLTLKVNNSKGCRAYIHNGWVFCPPRGVPGPPLLTSTNRSSGEPKMGCVTLIAQERRCCFCAWCMIRSSVCTERCCFYHGHFRSFPPCPETVFCTIRAVPSVPNYGRRHSAVTSLPGAAAWLACYRQRGLLCNFEYHLNIFSVFLFPASGSLSFCCWGPCAQEHSSFQIRTPSWTVQMGIPGTWLFCFYTS